ncbi:hypothetical protein L7F22_025359 [Adiantum nelumboides]|nr:hypothetical protein [Adiantum nelumboides]
MEVANHCPQALPHSPGGCTTLPFYCPATGAVFVDSPLQQYEELSPRNTDDDTKQQVAVASSDGDNDEPSTVMTSSQCILTQQEPSTVSLAKACCHGEEQQHQISALVPSLHSCILDPNAREFAPLRLSAPVYMQPVYTGAHPEIAISVCYQLATMQGSYSYEFVDTSLRLGLYRPDMAAAATPASNGLIAYDKNVPYTGFEEDCVGPYEHHANSAANVLPGAMDTFPQSRVVGVLGPVHGSPPLGPFNPLSIPASPIHMRFIPNMSVAPGLPSAPASMPPYLHAQLPYPDYVTNIPPQQAPTAVYTHKFFHPHHGWKEHVSRSLVISGVPPYLDSSLVRQELEHWGHVRAFHADRLSQGILSVQFFDLRASREALRDMQNQHLLKQQRFQQHLHAEHGMQFHSRMFLHGANEYVDSSRGLLCGNVVWAQYVASCLVPCTDNNNQGTLVLFNVDPDVALQELQKVFEIYGDVRELRKAPTKHQHKFVEYYDTRDAKAAWAALNGQEVCGKCVKIEFSRQGGPVSKQNNVHQAQSCLDLSFPHVQQMNNVPQMDPASYVWQCPNSHGLYKHDWHAGGDFTAFPCGNAIASSNTVSGPSGASSGWHGRYLKRERGLVTHMHGAIAGPRRKQVGLAKLPSKMYHVIMHEPVCAVLPASPKLGDAQKSLVDLKGHPQFEYDEEQVLSTSGQPRTTLMIKNIPNKYSQQMLLSLLDHHCVEYNSLKMGLNEPESAYDFVYLPIDFKNRCNLGYAFVNFTTALATLKFYKAFHAQPWEAFNSRKICDVKYARVQGRRALENHFCNSRFACDTMEFLPVAFVPPRNGFVCPPPIAAAGLITTKSGRPGPCTTQVQALLGPPPSHCKLLSASESHSCTPQSNCLLENSLLSGSDSENTIEDDHNKRDINENSSLAQV